jgi:hypothetical protein
MSENKQALGRSIPPTEKSMVEGVLKGIPGQAALGSTGLSNERNESMDADNESMIEEAAVQQGASVLFSMREDGFVSALAITLIPKELKAGSRRIVAVSQPFGFVCTLRKGERFAVITPQGYVTDFASIPKLAQGFISPFGKHAEAAVIHDWLYTLGKPGDGHGRRRADKTFRIALRLLDVGFFTRWLMYLAVRTGGGRGYGLPGDFTFRALEDLTIIDPTPPREPFYRTLATEIVPKAKRGKTPETAQA